MFNLSDVQRIMKRGKSQGVEVFVDPETGETAPAQSPQSDAIILATALYHLAKRVERLEQADRERTDRRIG